MRIVDYDWPSTLGLTCTDSWFFLVFTFVNFLLVFFHNDVSNHSFTSTNHCNLVCLQATDSDEPGTVRSQVFYSLPNTNL